MPAPVFSRSSATIFAVISAIVSSFAISKGQGGLGSRARPVERSTRRSGLLWLRLGGRLGRHLALAQHLDGRAGGSAILARRPALAVTPAAAAVAAIAGAALARGVAVVLLAIVA